MDTPHIFSFGYEKAAPEDVVAALKQAGVVQLIDVRARPISRKPGLSKRTLTATLMQEGIEYVGLPALGTPPDGRDAARDHRLPDLERIYDAQLDTPEALVAAEILKALVSKNRSAPLCFARNPEFCHCTLLHQKILKDYSVTNLYP